MANDEFPGIVPHFAYRKCAVETQRILALKPTQIDKGIAEGWLPPPTAATPYGRAKYWTGAELIEILKARKARAEQQRANQKKVASRKPKIQQGAIKGKSRRV